MTTILDLLAVVCFALLAFAVWPPACLAVVGAAALWLSREASR